MHRLVSLIAPCRLPQATEFSYGDYYATSSKAHNR
jgi:hypothetical protein